MVDINLFQDDDAEEEKREGGDENNTGHEAGDVFNDDLVGDFGEELSDELGLGDDIPHDEPADDLGDDLLGADSDIEESISLYDDLDDESEKDEYSSGPGERKQGASVFLWILLGIVAAAAAFYFFAIVPRQKEIVKKQAQVVKRPDVQKLIEKMKQERMKAAQDSAKGTDAALTANTYAKRSAKQVGPTPSRSTVSASSGINSNYADVTDKIVNVLINRGQLGAFLVFDDGFAVEYNSATPNSANELASKIGTLVGVSNLKISPEERHKTGGQVRYWGVISGKFPKGFTGDLSGTGSTFTAQNLTVRLKSIAKTQNLNIKKVQIFNTRYEKGRKIRPVRLKLDGSGTDVLAYMKKVCSLKGNFKVSKIMIAPVMLSDFHGRNLKVVLDLNVTEGNASP